MVNRTLYFRAKASVNTGWLGWLFKNEAQYVRPDIEFYLDEGDRMSLKPGNIFYAGLRKSLREVQSARPWRY